MMDAFAKVVRIEDSIQIIKIVGEVTSKDTLISLRDELISTGDKITASLVHIVNTQEKQNFGIQKSSDERVHSFFHQHKCAFYELNKVKPIYFSIEQGCSGIFSELTLFGEARFAAEDTEFRLPLPCIFGASQNLPRIVGVSDTYSLYSRGPNGAWKAKDWHPKLFQIVTQEKGNVLEASIEEVKKRLNSRVQTPDKLSKEECDKIPDEYKKLKQTLRSLNVEPPVLDSVSLIGDYMLAGSDDIYNGFKLEGLAVRRPRAFMAPLSVGGSTMMHETMIAAVSPSSALWDPWNPTQRVLKVWFGTNRLELQEGGFSNEDVPFEHNKLRVGVVDVSIPDPNERVWSMDGIIPRKFARGIVPTLDRIFVYPTDAFNDFWKDMRKYSTDKESFLFVHGYNNSFKDAAETAAFMHYALGFQGTTSFFSWPSCKQTIKYETDQDRVQEAEYAFRDFLLGLLNESKTTKLHIMAHSMGNRLVLAVLEKMWLKGLLTKEQLGQLIFVAADVPQGLFRFRVSEILGCSSGRMTLYASPTDKALIVSSYLHGNYRAGYLPPPLVSPKILDTIYVDASEVDVIGHGYMRSDQKVIQDILGVIKGNDPASRNLTQDDQQLWNLP